MVSRNADGCDRGMMFITLCDMERREVPERNLIQVSSFQDQSRGDHVSPGLGIVPFIRGSAPESLTACPVAWIVYKNQTEFRTDPSSTPPVALGPSSILKPLHHAFLYHLHCPRCRYYSLRQCCSRDRHEEVCRGRPERFHGPQQQV